MIYTAGNAALAALEALVHLGKTTVLPSYVLIACSFDHALIAGVDRARLPSAWRSYPGPPELQSIGDEWVKSGRSAVLEVPNVIIPTESNYLLNPGHHDFASIRTSRPQPFEFDLRLLPR